jgi:hypothetical protein
MNRWPRPQVRTQLRRALPCHDLTNANMSGVAALGRARGAVMAQDSSTCHWGRRKRGEVYLAACITVSMASDPARRFPGDRHREFPQAYLTLCCMGEEMPQGMRHGECLG